MKAILVIDMPSNCLDCPCEYDYLVCKAINHKLDYVGADNARAPWCPLKPLPTKITTATLSEREQERTELFTSMALLKTYADGWNDCLKGITDD